MAAQQSTSHNFEPFIVPVFVALLMACATIIYVEVENASSCFPDKTAAVLLYLSVLSYLVWRAVRNSDVAQGDREDRQVGQLSALSLVSIGLTPSLFGAVYGLRSCSDAPSIPETGYQIIAVALCVAFLLGVIGTLSLASAKTESLSKHIVVPAMLISLFLSLGSQYFFGYLSNYLPNEFLRLVLDIRYLLLGIAVLLIVLDALRLSESPSVIWSRVQATAERVFPIREVNISAQNFAVVLGLSFANIAVGAVRFAFQGVAALGLAAFDFIKSFGVAIYRFVVGGGTVYGIILSVLMVCSVVMEFEVFSAMDSIRRSIQGTGQGIEMLFWLFAPFYLVVCLIFSLLCRSQEGRIIATLDAAAKIGGLAVLGLWISSLLLHAISSITAFATLTRLNASGFNGFGSLGTFFYTVLVIAIIFSAYAIWSIASNERVTKAKGA